MKLVAPFDDKTPYQSMGNNARCYHTLEESPFDPNIKEASREETMDNFHATEIEHQYDPAIDPSVRLMRLLATIPRGQVMRFR